MRRFCSLLFIIAVMISPIYTLAWGSDEGDKEQALIIEVKGHPSKHKQYIHTYHPDVEVVSVYDKLFNGLAIKAAPEKMSRLSSEDFIKAVHPVQTYHANETRLQQSSPLNAEQVQAMDPEIDPLVIPETLNDTAYTGKGIKVGIIDTGIDYTHPDLQKNYRGGYDLVNLDEDPMETTPEEGIPTQHGSHVAGIIGGNGVLTGVAPDAELYAYRALGPGGVGSSIQIIAAMEQAVRDGVDIINLSLGNEVNGPDYPTSVAVNKASELGISIVIANGNSGPDDWTVGSPATASSAISIGATEQAKQRPYLYEPVSDKDIPLTSFIGSVPWQIKKDLSITTNLEDATGKIALIKRGEMPFYELAKEAEQSGAEAVLIYNHQAGDFQGSIEHEDDPVTIPVAQVSKEAGEWLAQKANEQTFYLDTTYEEKKSQVADFSSRGPVTVNWDIKPDIIAPGTDILSTVPGGYQILDGTSMAAPHVAGTIALLKEAKPDWSHEQILGALQTAANPLSDKKANLIDPIIQGAGGIQPNKAIHTSTILHDTTLTFGEMNKADRFKEAELTIENTTSEAKTYSFHIPKKINGMRWHLPKTLTLDQYEKKTVPIEITINPQLLEEGVHQGWLALEEGSETYQLPYLLINQVANNPKAMGFGFTLKPLEEDEYHYQIYLTEEAKSVNVHLYNPDTLVYEQHFLKLNDPIKGLNEGNMKESDIGEPGPYLAIISVELKNGDYESYETMVVIES